MIRLRFICFLSTFIPYLKKMINKDTVLGYINTEVISHLGSFQNFQNFTVERGILVNSDSSINYHKVEFKISINGLYTSASLVSENGKIDFVISMGNGNFIDLIFETALLLNHLKSIPTNNLKRLFVMFGTTL